MYSRFVWKEDKYRVKDMTRKCSLDDVDFITSSEELGERKKIIDECLSCTDKDCPIQKIRIDVLKNVDDKDIITFADICEA